MAVPSISDVIAVSKVSQYLVANDIARGSLMGRKLDPRWDEMLMMESEIVEWVYDDDNANTTLRATANYLYSLCYKINASLEIVHAGGGGTVVPVSPTPFTYLIPITSVDFTNATEYDDSRILGKELAIFWNDIPRYLLDSEWAFTSTGIEILVPGFDSTTANYTFYIYIVNPT